MNQRFPSGPVTIVYGRLFACGSGNSVTPPASPARRAGGREATSGSIRTNVETIHRLSIGSPSND